MGRTSTITQLEFAADSLLIQQRLVIRTSFGCCGRNVRATQRAVTAGLLLITAANSGSFCCYSADVGPKRRRFPRTGAGAPLFFRWNNSEISGGRHRAAPRLASAAKVALLVP